MLYRKSDSPFWWADIRIAGRRYRVSTKQKGKTLAAQVEAALIHQLSSGDSSEVRKKAPILRDYATNFLQFVEKSRLADKSKEYYRNGWRMLESTSIPGMRLDAITTSDAEMLQLRGAGATVNCALRTLRRILSLAEEKNIIPKVPKIRLVEEVERERLVQPAEEMLVLAKAPRVLGDAYLLMADCGLRPSDVVVLSWEQIDFVDGEILVEGGKTGKKARRRVQMSSRVKAMLIRRAKENDMGRRSPWVFPSVKSKREGKHMTAHGVSSRFSEFKREHGLAKEIVLYSARHTFATDITEATGDITKTQKTLGHSQLKTTTRYVHARAANTGAIMDARNAERHVLGHGTDAIQ